MMLLNLTPDRITKLLAEYEKFCSNIKAESLRMGWYMRGGVSYEDILNMSTEERTHINKIIEDNLETTKKAQMPFF